MEDQVEYANNVLRDKESGRGSYYKVLELSTNASNDDVKRAYKMKVLRVHPDKNKAPNAAVVFRAVISAYHTLKSPRKNSTAIAREKMGNACDRVLYLLIR